MTRNLDTPTLDAAAKYYAGCFMADLGRRNRDWTVQQFYNIVFKDEHAYMVAAVQGLLGHEALADFDARARHVFEPRSDKVFEDMLATKLAITPAGIHIPGQIGSTEIGGRLVGKRVTRHGMKPAYWPVYAGEEEERARGGGVADPLPPPDAFWPDETSHMGAPSVLMAEVTNTSIAWATAAQNAARVLLDEGSGVGVIQGRSNSGGQPVDPDATVLGTLLFTLGLAAVALGAAADATPGARSTAGAVTADASADGTGTLGYCRGSSSNDGATPLNSHIDGNAATSAAAFNFTTTAIVAGAEVSLTSWTVTQSQGPTAT